MGPPAGRGRGPARGARVLRPRDLARPRPASPDSGWSWQMVAAHAFVTLLTAVLWWAGRLAASYAVSVLAHPAVPVHACVRHPRSRAASRSPLALLLIAPRRGPPSVVLPT